MAIPKEGAGTGLATAKHAVGSPQVPNVSLKLASMGEWENTIVIRVIYVYMTAKEGACSL